MDVSLLQQFNGPLLVQMVVNAELYTAQRDFQDKNTTLFDYVGSVATMFFTNLTTRLTIATQPSDWQVLEFSPEARILRVVKIKGEQWEIEPDNPERFLEIFGFELKQKDEDGT